MVTKIEWSSEFETGIERIDFQHRNLLEMVNSVIAASEADVSYRAEAVRLILDQVVNYTEYHFKTEEELMLRGNYPDFAQHQKEHIALKGRVSKYVELVEKGDVSSIDEVVEFLKNWLIQHIGKSDRAYCSYLKDLDIF